MTEAFQIQLLNDSASPWVVDYRLADDPHTVTVSAAGFREVLATHYLDGSEWLVLTESKVISANQGIASMHPDTSFLPVVEALTVFMGIVCGIVFWLNANPLRK